MSGPGPDPAVAADEAGPGRHDDPRLQAAWHDRSVRCDEHRYRRSAHPPAEGHAGTDVLAFFKQIDATVAKGLSVHVILDNLSAHKAPEVRRWLAHKSRRRWHLHFIPTSSSWLNLVERWFKELTDKRLRRGVFTSVDNLTQAITVWAEHWNSDPKPFVWKATAEDIIKKVSRGRETLRQIKSSTDH